MGYGLGTQGASRGRCSFTPYSPGLTPANSWRTSDPGIASPVVSRGSLDAGWSAERWPFCRSPSRVRRSLISLLALLILPRALAAQNRDAADPPLSVTNRERTLRFSLLFDGETVSYRVDRLTPDGAENVVIDRSPLGIARGLQDFRSGFELVSASPVSELSGMYRMVTGKQREIRTRARQRVFTFRKGTGGLMTITVRAMRDGVAFRYGFPGASAEDSVVDESTGFHLPPGRAWLQPYRRGRGGYSDGIPIGTTAPEEAGWTLPMLFHTSDSWVLVTETGIDRTSYGVHVQQRAEDGLYRVRLPEEMILNGRAPAITLPWVSPWRVLIIGSTLGTIVESTLPTDLAQPQAFADVSWIKPGRVSGSMWIIVTNPPRFEQVFPYVDLSSRLRWEYTALEPGWQQETIGGDESELAAYARARGSGLIAWYNADPGSRPRDRRRDPMVDPEARRAELQRIAALGYKGIKIDVAPSDAPYVIALYQDILRDAYENRLFVDLGRATVPRGWQRTYPNLLTMQAVYESADTTFQDAAATYHTIYPFTRNVVGPMDNQPNVFGDGWPHLTTNPHELALSVVFESGLQHFASSPERVDAQPDYVRRFLTAVPTAWDETRFVDGYPGRLAVLARRRGTDWYVGAITSDTMVSVAEVPLRFLGAGTYDVALISDGEDVDKFAYATETLVRRDTMTVELAPRGGFVARFTRRGAAAAEAPAWPAAAEERAARPPAPRPTDRPRPAP